jgi:hypothetical protein
MRQSLISSGHRKATKATKGFTESCEQNHRGWTRRPWSVLPPKQPFFVFSAFFAVNAHRVFAPRFPPARCGGIRGIRNWASFPAAPPTVPSTKIPCETPLPQDSRPSPPAISRWSARKPRPRADCCYELSSEPPRRPRSQSLSPAPTQTTVPTKAMLKNATSNRPGQPLVR